MQSVGTNSVTFPLFSIALCLQWYLTFLSPETLSFALFREFLVFDREGRVFRDLWLLKQTFKRQGISGKWGRKKQ
jgi:hypothetical protein